MNYLEIRAGMLETRVEELKASNAELLAALEDLRSSAHAYALNDVTLPTWHRSMERADTVIAKAREEQQ